MTKLRTIQILRGTTAQNNAYTGVIGELTMDTEKKQLRIHDGSTVGGKVIGGDGITNQNTASGATNPIYDWVGTLAEYQAQNIETNHPDWVCYITDDFSAQAYDAYSKGQSDNLFVAKGHQVIEFQKPTAANNYTWYRKYADGWVEQGGRVTNANYDTAVSLPIEMAGAEYSVSITPMTPVGNTGAYMTGLKTGSQTTTGFHIAGIAAAAAGNSNLWQVSGMAA